MITLIQDTLDLWRDAERVLDDLPASAPDHETVALLVVDLRHTYARLTDASDWSRDQIDSSRVTLEAGRALLRRVRSG